VYKREVNNGIVGFETVIEGGEGYVTPSHSFLFLSENDAKSEGISYLIIDPETNEIFRSGSVLKRASRGDTPHLEQKYYDLWIPDVEPLRVSGGRFLSQMQVVFQEMR